MHIFCSNKYFRGVNIPEPETYIDLRQRLPNASSLVIDFLMV